MSTTTPQIEPANDLERALVQAQRGALPVAAFLDTLLASQVFVLINKDLGPAGAWDNDAAPMVLSNSAGVPVLAIFTAPERSLGWPQRQPQFSFGLLTRVDWLLRGVASGVGIVINPGLAIGLELSPDGVARLRSQAGVQ